MLGSWVSGKFEGRGGLGKGWVKVGQFITNLGLRWTFLSQLEGAKQVEGYKRGEGGFGKGKLNSKGNQQGEEESKGIAPCIS